MEPSHSASVELNDWVAQSAPRVLGYAWTLVHHRQVAEDLVQDCFCRLLTHADRYDLLRDGTKLLYRSVTNAAINWSRRQTAGVDAPNRADGVVSNVEGLIDRAAAEPVQMAIRHELEQAVAMAMQELPVSQRAAIELRSMGHSLIDVAEIMEVSYPNARMLLHRARTTLNERLRSFLEEHGP